MEFQNLVEVILKMTIKPYLIEEYVDAKIVPKQLLKDGTIIQHKDNGFKYQVLNTYPIVITNKLGNFLISWAHHLKQIDGDLDHLLIEYYNIDNFYILIYTEEE